MKKNKYYPNQFREAFKNWAEGNMSYVGLTYRIAELQDGMELEKKVRLCVKITNGIRLFKMTPKQSIGSKNILFLARKKMVSIVDGQIYFKEEFFPILNELKYYSWPL